MQWFDEIFEQSKFKQFPEHLVIVLLNEILTELIDSVAFLDNKLSFTK